ncbi:MAG TPA: non-homologous end-joining DNA ligase [Burkholderiaceae bacterium]|nr:non-homologous end-joining DNA ligase [Burkholderiaceae bacterium]
MATNASLQDYRAKRSFDVTSEPAGKTARRRSSTLAFVVQKHAARQLHYDFRLEYDGVLKSWAVPKGPSLDPAVKRMAVEVEDHPLEYANFEGDIPAGQYGAGNVIIWDRGTWIPLGDPGEGLRKGKLEFELRGKKLRGRWALVRMRKRTGEHQTPWLLIKGRDDFARPEDEYSVIDALPNSVKTHKPVALKRSTTRKSKPTDTAGAKRGSERATPLPIVALPRGVRLTHPERVIDTTSGVTKAEVMRYHIEAAERLLAQLRGRPVALVRAPEGVGGTMFFQKHARELRIPGIKLLDPKLDPGHDALLEIASVPALLGAVQMNVLEFHTWNARSRALEKPDRIVFDLDPGEGITWQRVQEGAVTVRALLQELGLVSFLKTSGGKGLHVIVPLQPRFDWDTVRALAQAVTLRLAHAAPDRFAEKSGAKNRVGRIFVDYLRNGRGATTVAAWSLRARPGLGVSVPVRWEELESLRAGDHWTVRNVGERLAAPDPWTGYAKVRQSPRAALAAFEIKPPRARAS